MQISTSFDFRTDLAGKDPNSYSPTLRAYHKHLWSKPLPCGRGFDLSITRSAAYLHHASELGEFFLSSNSIVPSFTRWGSMKHITGLFPEEENEAFRAIGYTIGGMMVFPANRVDGKPTINGMRGFSRQIADRFDLTLECIRRHYLGEKSPLGECLSRYSAFLALFGDFSGYVDFFLLQDLLNGGCSAVSFFMAFDDFRTSSVPRDIVEYREYRARSIAFVEAGISRIERHAASFS